MAPPNILIRFDRKYAMKDLGEVFLEEIRHTRNSEDKTTLCRSLGTRDLFGLPEEFLAEIRRCWDYQELKEMWARSCDMMRRVATENVMV